MAPSTPSGSSVDNPTGGPDVFKMIRQLQKALDTVKSDNEQLTADYGEFERRLRATFSNPDEVRIAERRLIQLKQRGSAAKYASEFKQIASKTEWSDDDTLMTLFYAGLREDVKDEVSKEDRPDEFDSYVERIVKIDNRLYERRLEKRGSKSEPHTPRIKANTGKPRQNHHRGSDNRHPPRNQKWQNRTSHGHHSGPIDLDATRHDKGRRDKDTASVTCYNCGKKGHYANKYRQKRKFQPVPEGNRQANALYRGENNHDTLPNANKTIAIMRREPLGPYIADTNNDNERNYLIAQTEEEVRQDAINNMDPVKKLEYRLRNANIEDIP
ncbi:uncharacterized protein JN550_002940 [Neoarthrinium moseri]|uniref:uncharacterized protein n=1 Tax=Neoarthrinium moseri TaxID=1658444 RepID=UPI001FDBDF35|nr:uncharacterized protein JN550_002940 [Neoarthrinium moseri]KAI1873671.1 hypothetical protein JN550_002940 [Neoarthrinium moseri]